MGLLVALLVVASTATADPSIEDKQAQARAVLDEVRELDSDLSKAIEEWNYANIELERIQEELGANARHLVVARKSLGIAQQTVAQRVRDLYVNGGSSGGVVEALLGAESLDGILDRLDVLEQVGEQDTRVLKAVKRFRHEVESRRERLRTARTSQAEIVEGKAQQKAWIESKLAERQRLLSSIEDEIERLQAEERRRQAELQRQAEAQLAAQRAANARSLSTVEETIADPYRAPAPALAPAPAAKYGGVVGIAMQYLGVPYVWGGMSPAGFDCSGFIAYVYAQVGVYLPHHAASQYNYGVAVSRDELAPGDLVFFDGLGHAGIYVGGGSFIHAPHTGDVVKISSLYDSWYASGFVGARRIL